MAKPDDAVARLEARAAQVPPRPSDQLAGRLRADRLTAGAHPAATRRRLRLPVLLPSVAVAALVLGFVLVAFGGSGGGPTSVVLETASNASVERDGHTVTIAAGSRLLEGTVVVTGPDGSVTAAGVTIGPGERAVVRRGRLERLIRKRRRSAATTSTTAAPPAPTTTTAPPTAATVAPPPRSTTSIPPASMGLTARRTPRGVVEVRWTRYDGADFSSYVVLRGNQRSVVVRLADQDRLTAVDRTPPAERTPYVVVVLDAAGKVVARSQVVGV